MTIFVRERHERDFLAADDDDLLVCRCEEVTKGDVRRALYAGLRTFGEVKRYLRVGMGLCQGQTCQRLILAIMTAELGMPAGQIGRVKGRAPMRPIVMGELATSGRDSEEVDDGVR
jgi:NAD(P)H-nitrite reductase large subunit